MALRGIKVLELAGLAPAPFCGAVLADFGATVIRVDRAGSGSSIDSLGNGKKSISLNLKNSKGVEIFHKLCKNSDVLIEPFRAGVMEKLGLGPNELLRENNRLIYARLTGFGQKGLYSERAGHDINFIAISGLLSLLGWEKGKKPSPPLNLAADFAGGSLTCALGIILALFERERSGLGQVVDCSMVEGTAYLGSWVFRSQDLPIWGRRRAENVLDGGAFFYDTYETKDGHYMAVGALEPQFYLELLKRLGLRESEVPQLSEDPERHRQLFKSVFSTKTREEWCKVFDGCDACVTPVLTMEEAAKHKHNVENKTFSEHDGKIIPRPAPNLSRTPGKTNAHKEQPQPGEHTEEILSEQLGFSKAEIENFENLGAIMRSKL